ncbi:exported hypothetical protein [Nitrospina gracilis 3/211]|uniref:Lipoprotein n=1 Tax=Nitrospina gracilis (strain 3/211) TaxID=1266370 RepID=M1ZCK4_NITG3|nr:MULTISPECIES: hypothetical protein [Nitrospina]MCF8723968.1 uncharacterized protein YceK [Nitrospina sp. Nb-3]CCQ91092.1 exported hypothetical protein [Nitrospina gracilis 3/211]
MIRIILSVSLFIILAGSTGCSAILALTPDTEDPSVIRTGTTQEEIENEFGSPVEVSTDREGTLYIYEFEIEPTGDPTPGWRATYYSMWDLFTLLILEPKFWYDEIKWEANYLVKIRYHPRTHTVTYFSIPKCHGDCDERTWVEVTKLATQYDPYTETLTYRWNPKYVFSKVRRGGR